jgi:tetratricopeptide (TPR) repeat protein
MVSIACPQCSTPIPAQGRCSQCGLDASLLLRILGASARLTRTAAQRAGDGVWQEAYNAAAESLRLSRRDNDLAAFVLLAATLAGAQGAVATVPRPRAEALPTPLAPLVDGVLGAATKLRGLAESSSPPAELEEALRGALRELDEHHPLLSYLRPKPPIEEMKRRDQKLKILPGVRKPEGRPVWPALTAAALAALILGAVVVWSASRMIRTRSQGQITDLTRRLQHTEENLRNAQSRPATKPPEDPLGRAISQLENTGRPGHPSSAAAALRDDISRRAWRRGYDASVRHRYDEARELLELAIEGPHKSEYWDDALYYLGKAYHRLGRREEARAAYQRLEREAPSSPFLPEARRLLVRLDGHEGAGR